MYSKEHHLWFQCSSKAIFCTKHLALTRSHCSVVSKHNHHNETPQLGALKAWDQSRLWTSLRNMSLSTEWSLFAFKCWDFVVGLLVEEELWMFPNAPLSSCHWPALQPTRDMMWHPGLDRHGYFKPLKCPSVLSSVTKYHHTLQSTDSLSVFSPFWMKTHCWHPFLNFLFLPPCGHCCGLLCPQGCPSSPF